jgi:hypothetical protein
VQKFRAAVCVQHKRKFSPESCETGLIDFLNGRLSCTSLTYQLAVLQYDFNSSRCIAINTNVLALCLEYPQIALSALKLLAGRLRKCAELVETLSLRDVDQRLARWLLTQAKSRGTRTNGLLKITLRLTRQQIASRIGSVRVVGARALTRLQQNGLIKVEGRSITITNEEALTSFADD